MLLVHYLAILLSACPQAGGRGTARMTPSSFDSLFERFSISQGTEYLQSRDAILALPSRDQIAARLGSVLTAGPSWRDQLAASILLGWMEHREGYERVSAYLRQPLPGPRPATGFSPAVRGKAIASLGRAITPRVLEMLWNAPEYRNNNELGSLLSALIYLKDDRAVQPLIALIESSKSPPLRRGAIKVLSELGDPRAVAVVSRLADGADDASVRLTAVAGLGGFPGNAVIAQLLSCLQTRERTVEERRAAAMALYKQGSAAAHDGVTRALREERAREVRLPLILLMGDIGDDGDVGLLQELVRHDAKLQPSVSDAIQQIRRRAERY